MIIMSVAAILLSAGANQVSEIAVQAAAVQPKVVSWRRDIHTHPELGNREFRTSGLVANHLRDLGLEVRTGVGVTGVVGVLRGGQPGGVVALRADMDALPVEEKTGLAFASHAVAPYLDGVAPVMHACGHDAHVAMLMGAAEVLTAVRSEIRGTVVFVFQPAEEGAPPGETGGAARMMAEGVFADPVPEAIFGMHVTPGDSGEISYRARGFYAAADRLMITLTGAQTHAARPWAGVDVISLGAEVVLALNTFAARQLDVTASPTVITIATVDAGIRNNIIPEQMVMTGTIRTFDPERRREVMAQLPRLVTSLADRYGASAVTAFDRPAPLVFNEPELATAMLPSLVEAAGGRDRVEEAAAPTSLAEDFSFFTRDIPGLYVQLGARPPGIDAAKASPNHSPYFDIDEQAMETGVRVYAQLAFDYLAWRDRP